MFFTTVHNLIWSPYFADNGTDPGCEPTRAATRTTGPTPTPRLNQLLVAHSCMRQAGGDLLGDLRLGGKRSALVAAMVPGDPDVPNTGIHAHLVV